MADHFLLIHSSHCLLHLFKKHLGNSATQGVDCVQKFGLERIEQRLEQVVFKGILKQNTPGGINTQIL